MHCWQTRPVLALLAALAAAPQYAYAENWLFVAELTTGQFPQKTYIDTDSYRTEDGYVIYRIRIEINWGNSGRLVIRERFVVTDCAEQRRFEVTTPEDWKTRNFKSVFAGTLIAKEVAVACQRQMAERGTPTPTPPRTPEIAKPSPVDSDAIRSTGSGFAVSTGSILTNAHVVSDCKSIAVRQGSDVMRVELFAKDNKLDLAILKTNQPISIPAQLRLSALLGEDIMIAGYPLAGILATDLIVTNGQVNSLAGLRNDPTLLQISAPVQPGNSGGPVIDRAGAVVGVVVSKLNAERISRITGDIAQNVNFAIKPEVIRLFLDANSIQHTTTAHGVRVEGTELAQRARRYTFQVLCYNY